ncbi:hypothetical protein [Pueribacillus sp. YX66]|uniref:hypothetical protein n=1 Tax=Pueribacillus sp. YX66 TaxID=3229242 RepID=UPI00358CF77A
MTRNLNSVLRSTSKLNGTIGKIRKLLEILIFIVFLLIFVIFLSIVLPQKINSLLLCTGIFLVFSFAYSFIYFFVQLLFRNYYDIRPLTDKEWNELSENNAIHYTSLSPEKTEKNEYTLKANPDKQTTKYLTNEFRGRKFVWFHLSDSKFSEEPTMRSFHNAHYLEGNPRPYKYVLPIHSLPRDKTYIIKSAGYILVEGDVTSNSFKLLTNFKWYNDKIYFRYIFRGIHTSLSTWDLLFGSQIIDLKRKLFNKQK